CRALDMQSEYAGARMPERRCVGKRRSVRPAALLEHLERSHDATAVLRVDPRGRHGVLLAEPVEQGTRPEIVELRLQASTHGGVPRWKAEVEDHTGDVEPRPTDEDGVAAALMDLLHGGAGKRLIPGDSRLFGDLTDIEQMMRDAA